jgi:hypothetical protein
MSCSQTVATYNETQARLSANLSAAPLNRNIYNTSNVPVQYGTTTRSSLPLDPRITRQDFPSYQQRSMAALSSDALPFCHYWARSGITLDISDFSTDFWRSSQLDASMYSGHVPEML